MISITRNGLGSLLIKPASGGAQIRVQLAGKLQKITAQIAIARQGPPGLSGGDIVSDPIAYYILAKN